MRLTPLLAPLGLVVALAACGSAPTADRRSSEASGETPDGSNWTIDSSPTTQTNTGVVQWQKTDPTTVKGVDGNGNAVVEVKGKVDKGAGAHGEDVLTLWLRDGINQAMSQFILGKDGDGAPVLKLLQDMMTGKFDSQGIIGMLMADLMSGMQMGGGQPNLGGAASNMGGGTPVSSGSPGRGTSSPGQPAAGQLVSNSPQPLVDDKCDCFDKTQAKITRPNGVTCTYTSDHRVGEHDCGGKKVTCEGQIGTCSDGQTLVAPSIPYNAFTALNVATN